MLKASWTWTQDRQWSASRFKKNWNMADQLAWEMEVRSDEINRGCSTRLGELYLTGSMDGTLTCRIREEDI